MATFNHCDLLILGDSFAYERNDSKSWVCILSNLLTGNNNPRGFGFAGCAWWSTRKLLLSELKNQVPKILILCHTESMRIPSDHDFPLNNPSVNTTLVKPHPGNPHYILWNEKIRAAGKAYYDHLISTDFHLWAQKRWFDELDDITESYKIPYVIHMHCFEPWGSLGFYVWKNGLTVEETLWENTTQYKQWQIDPEVVFKKNTNQEIINHFSLPENARLAECLFNAINTYSPGKRKIGL